METTKDFKPTILRKAVLFTLLCITLVLIVLVEYACRVLPRVERKGGGVSINSILGRREGSVQYTRDSPAVKPIRVPRLDSKLAEELDASESKLKRQIQESLVTISTPLDTGPTVTVMPPPSDFLQISPTPPVEIEPSVSSIPSSSFPSEIAGTPAPSSYLQIDPTGVPNEPTDAPTLGYPPASEFLQPTTVPSGYPPASDFLQPTPAGPAGPAIPPPPGVSTGAPNPVFLNSVITSNGKEITQTIIPNVVLTSVATIDGKPVTQAVPAFTTLITTNGSPHVSIIPVTATATATATGRSKVDNLVDDILGGERNTYINGDGMYFLGAYLPVLLATMFALPWTLIGETTKSLELFYHMAKSSGAPADRSLTANFNDLLAPLWALFGTQWAVVISSVLAWLAFLIVPLAPEAVSIRVIGECNGGCNGRIGVFLPAARAIEGVLVVMVVFEIFLILYLRKKKTGVNADPRCIAGLATLFSDPEVQREFSEAYRPADRKRLDKAFKDHTYRLESFSDADGYTRTVAIVGGISLPAYAPPIRKEKHEYATVSTMPVDQQLEMRYAHRVSAVTFAVFIAGLLAVILTYRFTGGDTGFEHFMSGQGFGVKFMFTAIAVIVTWFWGRLFRSIALYAPYRRLFSGNTTARESILLSPPLHPIWGIKSSVSAGHYLLAVIAGIGLLSEALCVTLSAIPFQPTTLFSAYNVSTWISVSVLGVMLFTLVFIFFYREPIMPIKPDTAASHLMYLCDSPLPELFKELGGQGTKERDQIIEQMGLRYAMGYSSSSGVDRLAVLTMGGANVSWH